MNELYSTLILAILVSFCILVKKLGFKIFQKTLGCHTFVQNKSADYCTLHMHMSLKFITAFSKHNVQ